MKTGEYSAWVPATRLEGPPSDEELMRDLAAGHQEALGPLYGRYAGLVYRLAARSLDSAGSEELVQETFLAVWRGAHAFDPRQGAFKPWLLRLARWRMLNALRQRRRRPTELPEAPGDSPGLDDLADAGPGPEEAISQREHDHLVRTALNALPPAQRDAVVLAFLDGLTHEEVARALQLPLGTAKTRIRTGLRRMRARLAPLAASLLGLALAVAGVRLVQVEQAYQRDERALPLLTTSEVTPLRLTPASSVMPAGAHANYRGRAGMSVAVLSTELLPASPTGASYQAWVRHDDRWTPLGPVQPDASGVARVIAEDPALATPPDAVEITLESTQHPHMPNGQVMLAWPPG